jgi:glucokinase
MKRRGAIGIDLGGTKILTGAIDFNGKLIGSPVKIPTIGKDPAEAIVGRLFESVERFVRDTGMSINDFEGIGIGSTGPLDLDTGYILECPQLPNMNFFPLRDKIQDYFGIPVLLNNDANCLIYGESIFGAGADKKNIIGFTLGTGLGCALVIGKQLINGATGTAGEIWISPYRSGNIEDIVSGDGIAKIYKGLSGEDRSAAEIYDLAFKGDTMALQTWREFGEHLAVPVSWSINIVDPDIVILGGSITAAYPYFRASFENVLLQHICPVPAKKTKIVLAKLGENAGFIGAASLVINKSVS